MRRAGPRLRAALALACLLALAVSLLVGPAADADAAATAAPDLDAAAWVLIDPRDGKQLASHGLHDQRSIASTTKLMTAYLALQDLKLSDRLVVPAYSPAPAESVVGLKQGERLTVKDLLLAMLLPSANDAAETVAVGIGGSEGDFVGMMNRAAKDLGLTDTRYSNPIGLDDIGNYSSAADLATLAATLLDDRRFRRIVSTPEADLSSGSVTRHVVSTNTLMLSDASVDGVKTGHTLDAGYVLVASARRHGVPLLSVVLGASSEDGRDAESAELLDYGFSRYETRCPFSQGDVISTADVAYEDAPLELVADGRRCARARADQDLAKEIVEAPTQVEGPISEGQPMGAVRVLLDGDPIGRVTLVAGSAVAAPSFVDRIGGLPVLCVILVALVVILLLVVLALRRRSEESGESGRSAEERMRSRLERTRRRTDRGGPE